MSLSRAELDALLRRREAEVRAAVAARAESIAAIPDPGARMRAYAELVRSAGEDGNVLPAEAEDRIVQSLRTESGGAGGMPAATAWSVERRRMALLHTLRPMTVVAILAATALPFFVAAWRLGLSPSDAAGAFLASAGGLAGVALALLAGLLLAWKVAAAGTAEGLAGLVVAAMVAGVVGLAVTLRMAF